MFPVLWSMVLIISTAAASPFSASLFFRRAVFAFFFFEKGRLVLLLCIFSSFSSRVGSFSSMAVLVLGVSNHIKVLDGRRHLLLGPGDGCRPCSSAVPRNRHSPPFINKGTNHTKYLLFRLSALLFRLSCHALTADNLISTSNFARTPSTSPVKFGNLQPCRVSETYPS